MNNNNQYKSCCYKIDKQFAMFIVSVAVVISALGLSVYKLIVEKECSAASPYYSLLSSLSGIAAGITFSTSVNKRSPEEQGLPMYVRGNNNDIALDVESQQIRPIR
jgi:hypothetical protein